MYRYWLSARRHRPVAVIILLLLILTGSGAIWAANRPGPVITDFISCAKAGYDVSNTDPQTCSDGRHTFVAPTAPPTKPSDQALQSFSILVDGDAGGDYTRNQLVITNQADWASYWSKVNVAVKPFPPLLPIDFTSQSVVAINEGPQPTNGYSLAVTGITSGSQGSVVTYQENTPGNCPVKAGLTNRYYIVSTAKLTAPVTFQAQVQKRHC